MSELPASTLQIIETIHKHHTYNRNELRRTPIPQALQIQFRQISEKVKQIAKNIGEDGVTPPSELLKLPITKRILANWERYTLNKRENPHSFEASTMVNQLQNTYLFISYYVNESKEDIRKLDRNNINKLGYDILELHSKLLDFIQEEDRYLG